MKNAPLSGGPRYRGQLCRAQRVALGVDEGGGPLLEPQKRWKWFTLISEALASKNLTIQWYANMATAGATARGSAAISMTATDRTHGQTRIDLLDTNGDHMRSKSIRLRVGDDADDGPWAVPVFALSYQVIPGLAPRA